MKIFRETNFLWLGPGLAAISGIINLLNSNISNGLRIAWYIITPISIIGTIYGIICHVYSNKK